MTQQEYEQKKRECWEEFCKDNGLHADGKMFAATDKDFSQLIDRAYALAGQKEPISQEEIEKAAVEFAERTMEDVYSEEWDSEYVQGLIETAWHDGISFALGKQEKDADAVISGWVARDEVAIRPTLYTSKPLRQKKGFENGYWSYGMQIGLSLDPSLFPDLTWESDPEPVEITIKRKNHE